MRTLILLTISFFISLFASAQGVKSYMENEIVGQSVQGPLSEVPQHSGTWVEWDATGDNIVMMDGTKWKKANSSDGLLHYRYVGTSGQAPSFTQLIEAIFSADLIKMNIRYNFGPAGMSIPMVGKYSLLGDGAQLAIDWVNMPDDE